MAIVPSDVKTRFPEFSAVADARVQTFIDKALLHLDESLWGTYFIEGQLYLTAHFLSLSLTTDSSGGSSPGVSGPVASRSIGDVSVSFVVPDSSNTTESSVFYGKTPYGQEYWRMVKIVGEGIVAVV